MKIKQYLAALVAATCVSQAQAGQFRNIDFKPSDGTPIVQTSAVGEDLQKPIRFVRCDSGCCDAAPCSSSDCCDPSCCDASGASCCDGLAGGGLFGGLIKQSEHCYDDFISPMTNPVYFEDPRQLTELRGIFIDHKLPVILGQARGGIQLYALQARVRLSERLSLIAVKDGFIVSQSDLISDGFADIGAGLKYSLYRDGCAGRLLSAGMRFETYSGRPTTLQGNGTGVFDFFLSWASRLGTRSHYMGSAGFILPNDTQAENQMFYSSSHLDRRMTNRLYAFTELNWFHYMDSGNGLPVAGGDLFNLGSSNVNGADIVTNAYGLKLKPNRNLEIGSAFEFPLTDFRGVLDNRITADLIWRF